MTGIPRYREKLLDEWCEKNLFASDKSRDSPFDLSVLYLDIIYCRLYRNTHVI